MAPVSNSSTTSATAVQGGGRISFRVQWRTALVLWLVMAACIALLVSITWLFWRDGPPAQTGTFGWVLLSLFWIGGLAASAWASTFAMVSMLVDERGVEVSERHPFTVRTTRCGVADLSVPAIVDGVDGDGDPQFRCELRLPDGRAVNLAESYRRFEVDAVRRRVLLALAINPSR